MTRKQQDEFRRRVLVIGKQFFNLPLDDIDDQLPRIIYKIMVMVNDDYIFQAEAHFDDIVFDLDRYDDGYWGSDMPEFLVPIWSDLYDLAKEFISTWREEEYVKG